MVMTLLVFTHSLATEWVFFSKQLVHVELKAVNDIASTFSDWRAP